MNIQAEVDEQGVVKITDPSLWGKKVLFTTSDQECSKPEGHLGLKLTPNK